MDDYLYRLWKINNLGYIYSRQKIVIKSFDNCKIKIIIFKNESKILESLLDISHWDIEVRVNE